MAAFSRPPAGLPAHQAAAIERVESWTVSQTADLLRNTSLSPQTTVRQTPRATIRGTTTDLDIPLDTASPTTSPPSLLLPTNTPRASETVHTVYKRREPIRRDSQKRREALLKGKEGSRRRQRWENDRLLSNPHAEPPLPSDWQVQPTYPIQSVPYFLAPLWDAEYARRAGEREKREAEGRRVGGVGGMSKEEEAAAKVMREVRARLKRAKGAKGLLQDLEEEVRGFVAQWEEKERELEREGVLEADSEDEEIVFVGRNGGMSDEVRRCKQGAVLEKDKMVFESLLDDHGAAFGRYLVHAIGLYYGLKTWSVTTGSPARREAYVGLKIDPKTRRPSLTRSMMPQPLWAAV